jgi:Mg-chelatase subunit ChlD
VLDDGEGPSSGAFSEEAQAISVSVILDTSGSMSEARPKMLAAAGLFLDNCGRTIAPCSDRWCMRDGRSPRTRRACESAMDLIPPDPGSPIWAALDRAVSALQPETSRRVIVMYTDGRNTNIGQYNYLKATNPACVSGSKRKA